MSYNVITSPQPSGPIVTNYPFAGVGDTSHVIIEMPHMVETLNYSPLTLNTASGSYFYVGDDNRSQDSGVTTFNRLYANVPASRTEFETYTYTFPGVFLQRKPFTKTVPCEVVYDYYLVGSGGSYSTASDIPVIESTTYTYGGWAGPVDSCEFYLTPTSTPSTATYFSTTGSSIVVQPSSLRRYIGNIYERATKKVRAY